MESSGRSLYGTRGVILSGETGSQREALSESKDPYKPGLSPFERFSLDASKELLSTAHAGFK